MTLKIVAITVVAVPAAVITGFYGDPAYMA